MIALLGSTRTVRKDSIVDRIEVVDVLRAAGRPEPNRRGLMRCPSPTHVDNHASARVQPSGRGVRCHACGWRGGVLDVAVALGIGYDRASAARELERKLCR